MLCITRTDRIRNDDIRKPVGTKPAMNECKISLGNLTKDWHMQIKANILMKVFFNKQKSGKQEYTTTTLKCHNPQIAFWRYTSVRLHQNAAGKFIWFGHKLQPPPDSFKEKIQLAYTRNNSKDRPDKRRINEQVKLKIHIVPYEVHTRTYSKTLHLLALRDKNKEVGNRSWQVLW